ncbi:hypothetical protein RhiirA5_452456 [Rhizophagus irregularis]|uniref:Uncharacterized protein n=5 Tax=Rhizophagus irregularis TaxID=588596 RepID=U9SXN9_RHIID|nr:hypothetical protein GLOIN_2v1835724 [Rhizophagus irregularis DAOM 181602=DAOM 197198]EXX76759.1 hypothetical protein RirG_030110 [Rhizophagus irregularis DAOM 197198w]PKC03040.1 hypothetical protein RhiirA5_452456 [Rhizophagus irregularis]PKY23649.1 hypothetical protein RhiirB3_506582 [Rhizophagus irregularis]POG80434.1 hypothetical protein GLOIN_2v1835724 [Rhizophagus irregularis DAOM 181602=DAOM 197198]UZO06174.1 hypothetical protein OCT59_026505 [Rhizophagus irregularis]|eukprot:XP_025187300.1 hypothetical protein GLOIN_2v1835724 [Rhizophagus irregularis DAOM 181602=DAOM 197198]
MEQLSTIYSTTQSVNYPSQNHNWTNTDVISSYKEVCEQLYIRKEELREEREQEGQKKLRKSSSHSKLSQKAAERSNNVDTGVNIENISIQLKQQEGKPTLSVSYVGNGNELVLPMTLRWKDMDSAEHTPMVNPSSYVNRILSKRRNRRQLRHGNTYALMNLIRQLPRQNVNDPFANQIFNGSNFF